MTDEQIERITGRFLMWPLPSDFHPDDGISFEPRHSVGTSHEGVRSPNGTNLLNYSQAREMVEYILRGFDG